MQVTKAMWQHGWIPFGNSLMVLVVAAIILSDILLHSKDSVMRLLGRRIILVAIVCGLCVVSMLVFRVTGRTA